MKLTMESGFDGITRRYVRNPAGLVSEVIRPGKKSDRYLYNPLGQIARIERFDNSWESYSYDKDGLLTEAKNLNSHVQLKRDKMGRIVKEIQDGHVVESTYNKTGERVHAGSSLGADIRLGYDKSGYLSRVQAAQNEDNPWQMQLSYNGVGQETERILSGGVTAKHRYNLHGRLEAHTVQSGSTTTRRMEYRWGMNDRLMYLYDALTGDETGFTYDNTGTLTGATYPDGTSVFRVADAVGNLYKSTNRKDRKYGAGGRLLETEDTRYHYDEEGNLTEKNRGNGENWKYRWNADGSLKEVVRPDRKTVEFEYDALGRRTAKVFEGQITRWVWDGNTPLHEWRYKTSDRPRMVADEFGFEHKDREEPIENLTTWVFEEGTFKPAAKITEGKQYSIITDYLGTPVQMYDGEGKLSWDCTLDIYGKVNTFSGYSSVDCPFRYQGQYEDEETGLYYNRFRYYSPEEGMYISQDPIGLEGNNPTIYGYVYDTNGWVDAFGLSINLNTNTAKGNFGVYEISIDDKLYKIGKADLGRVTQSSGLPTRLHQQVRKLQELHPDKVVTGKVVEKGFSTTATAKSAETTRLQAHYDKTGKVLEGNKKSFKPKTGCG